MNLREQILALNTQIAALETELDSATMERIAEIDTEVKGLIEKRNKLEAEMRAQVRRGFQSGTPEVRTTEEEAALQERARALMQGRSISIDAVDVLSIDHQANDLKPTFNQVSSLVDQIGIVGLNGGESFKQGYLKG
jgi:chromosome segregation ATPase